MTTPPTPDPLEGLRAELAQLIGYQYMSPEDGGQGWGEYDYNDVGERICLFSVEQELDAIMRRVAQAVEVARLTERAEMAQELLDSQDQESDYDGRPVGYPYFVFSGDGERYVLERIVEDATAQIANLTGGQADDPAAQPHQDGTA